MRRVAGHLLAGTALISCPCHLVVLLPAALGLLGGTALGAALAANVGWVVAGATAYFAVALAGTLYLLYGRADNGKVTAGRPRPPVENRENGVQTRKRGVREQKEQRS